MSPIITVIGSSNTDMMIKSSELPALGETIIGNEFLMNPGGKGANQAVAAARLGGDVSLVAKTGDDLFGERARQQYKNEDINTEFIFVDTERPSGVALIMVNSKGENCISVAAGANGTLNKHDIEKSRDKLDESDIILMQLEIPLAAVEYVVKTKSETNRIILNPAPAQELTDELLQEVYVLTPNIPEAEVLSGIEINGNDSVKQAAKILKERGVQNVIITLGEEGAYLLNDEVSKFISPPVANAVDSTAAGDTFNGALAVALGNKRDFIEATRFANQAASMTVEKMGAQRSIPYRKELQLIRD